MYPVTIILPVYNGMKYLEQSVNSVLVQEYTNFELLIVDDCSNDGSREWIHSIKDKRVTLFQNKNNRGLFFNLNFLIKKSKGNIIKLWSQDDVMYSNCITEVAKFHEQHPEIGFSYTGRDYIDEAGHLTLSDNRDDTPAIVSSSLHARIAFFTGSIAGNIANVAINRFALNKAGLFNEKMKISGDFEMWVRIAKDYSIGFIKKPLIQLRNHKGQLSAQEKYFSDHLKEDIQAYEILLGYISNQQKKEGRVLLRNYKLLFYYRLMIKAFVKGRLKTAWEFCKMLHYFDNIFILTGYFIKNKLFTKANYVRKD
jgi:glycosyltransferase involved in cell wall biosynthesis